MATTKGRKSTELLWSVDLGWPPHVHQAALSLRLHQQDRGENMMKNLRVKTRTGSLQSNYHQGQNRLDSEKLI